MARLWLYIICVVAVVGVNADDLSDFSNNLATDIGPLLVLFGESMTRQYLSESTTYLDYFIFAMAPIGIITAIVSTIRVCGHPSLRAFIGRSQEGDGIIEAELCSSTSRDVCELFNKGGITRVLGRPNILELVHIQRGGSLETQDLNADKTELFLFRYYLEKRISSGASDWTKVKSSKFRCRKNPNGRDRLANSFAPKPNLSLNVGIKKQKRWVFFAVAATGFILQAGILALASVGVWVLHWNLSEGGSESRGYAPVMFITGTVLMCGGMWSCAALIGQTTYELSFERKPQHPSQSSRLLWLQPGPQVIGDQTFDPFAYFEDTKKDPLRVWTSSTKDFREKFEAYTFFAILAVLIGYIVQFIGLRGMKAWVSLTQLGITVVMSILRGLLRMQRLDRDDNKLADFPDLVVGHELDWLALKIALPESQGDVKVEPLWHITDQYETAMKVRREKNGSKNVSQCHESSSETNEKAQFDVGATLIRTNSTQPPATPKGLVGQNTCKRLLLIRERLSHLTGHNSFNCIKDSEYEKWNDDCVKVRTISRKLSTAICQVFQTTESPFQKRKTENNIFLRIRAATAHDADDRDEQLISVTLKQTFGSTQNNWSIDSAQLEAILGLWMWSLVSDRRLRTQDDYGHIASLAEKVETARIISAGPDNDTWNQKSNVEGEMDLWLGPNAAVELPRTTLALDEHDSYSLINLWMESASNEVRNWEALPKGCSSDQSQLNKLRRFCGWHPVYKALRSGVPDSNTILVHYYLTNDSLLDVCTQELFVALTMSLTTIITPGETAVVESDGNIRLMNPTVSALANAFVSCSLGSYSDALLCLVPAFGRQVRPPSPEIMLSALTKEAQTYRRRSEWERAEVLLQWACRRYYTPSDEEKSTSNSDLAVKSIYSIGELYRWSLAQISNEERKQFGIAGIEWMNKNYRNICPRNQEVTRILDSYQSIAERISALPTGRYSNQATSRTEHPLVRAIQGRNRTEALYHLCFITTGDFRSEDLQPALPLAVRNGWMEAVDAILEMKANPNSRDKAGRTAISYCAELGIKSCVKVFIDLGVFLDQPDRNKQTPLLWAVKTGHIDIADTLVRTRNVNCDSQDKYDQTPLWWAAKGGHEPLVQLLLNEGADIEAKDSFRSQTPLWLAAIGGHESIVQLLLDKDAEIEAQDSLNNQTPLWLATKGGYQGIVRLLLDKGANTEVKSKFGQTPLWLATNGGHTAIARMLLDKHANIEATDSHYSKTPLSLAANSGHEDIARLLLGKGANTEAKSGIGQTPLSLAAKEGHAVIAGLLLDKDAKIEVKDNYGQTPLTLAAEKGHDAIVELLLGKGADIEVKDSYHSQTPLSLAAMGGHEAVIWLLLVKGADIETRDNYYSQTPLSMAANEGHETIVQLLLNNGADYETKNSFGQTPLWLAAKGGHEDVVQLLFDVGADIEAKDTYCQTPLSKAAEEGHNATVWLLLDKGVNVEAKDSFGQTPLSKATKEGNETATRMLLDKHANIETKDDFSRTPLWLAAEKGNGAILRLLLDMGADIEAKDIYCQTPLSKAAERGDEAAVRLLLKRGANIKVEDKFGQIPLSLAQHGGHEVVVQLLLDMGANFEAKDSYD